MRAFQQGVLALSRWAAWVSALVLILMVGHILVEIVLRTFFDTSTFVLDEMVGYGVAAMAFLALAYTLESGALIRVNLLLNRFAADSPVRRGVELVCCFATLTAMCVPVWFFGRSVIRNYQDGFTSGTIADVPAWIPELPMFLGLVLFWLQLLAYTLRVLLRQVNLDASRAANIGAVE